MRYESLRDLDDAELDLRAGVAYKRHMETKPLTILRTERFGKWLKGLRDQRAQAKIAARIVRLEAGLLGDVKAVGDGVSEVRIDYGPGYRLYFTRRGEELVILLCGGDKDTQDRDIALAKEMAAEIE